MLEAVYECMTKHSEWRLTVYGKLLRGDINA
jgi:hypothetical protein